jgi:carboxyl-terminal processing protease
MNALKRVFLDFFSVRVPLWLIAPVLGMTLVFGMGGGYVGARQINPSTECPESPEVCAAFGVFWQAWNIARQNFVDREAVDPKRMTEGAIIGMLDSLGDQGHTRFLSAEETARWTESLSGSFEGIGAYIDVREGQTIIVAPIEGSPAEAAGIRPNDIILAVDGVSTEGWTVETLVTNVRGPRGSKVVLTVLHQGETTPVDITITRDRVQVPSVTWAMLPDDIALVRLSSFSQRSASELEAALTEAQQAGAKGLIFDLRDNPGGLVNEALGVASQFLPEGSVVLQEEYRDGSRKASRTNRTGVAQDIPMVVLINANTASSSEIVSGALQEAERAELVGLPTVGTGTVLSTFALEDGSQLLLGTSQWLTPQGRLIRKQGIAPDVEVGLESDAQVITPSVVAELDPDELMERGDAQVLEAHRILTGNSASQ